MTDRRLVSQFLCWTFGISYAFGLLYYAAHRLTGGFEGMRWVPFSLVLYMWVPALVTIVLVKRVYRRSLREIGVEIRLSWAWLGAWIYPLSIAALTLGVCLLFGWGELDTDFSAFIDDLAETLPPEQIEIARESFGQFDLASMLLMMTAQAVAMGATINALAAFGEELGWRGLLHTALRPMGFWKANLLIGLIWGLWHAPIIATGYNFPDYPLAGTVVMTLGTMALSPLIGFVRERSGSVIAASIFHGVLNASAGLPIVLIAGAPNILRSPLGLAGIIAMIGLIAISIPLVGLGREP